MKSNLSNFFGRILGNLLIVIGIFLGIFLIIFVNLIVGIIVSLSLVMWGSYLVFKADRMYGHVIYNGGDL